MRRQCETMSHGQAKVFKVIVAGGADGRRKGGATNRAPKGFPRRPWRINANRRVP